ncbi:MAG: hypothetical protein U0768_12020 [Anaerolineae bacterium]
MAGPIRIVPTLTPAERGNLAAQAPQGHLTYHGGRLLTSVEVFTIFWGSAWQQPPQNGLVPQLNQFFDSILTSSLIDVLSEYSIAGQTIGHGRRTGTTTITTNPNLVVSDGDIQAALQSWIMQLWFCKRPGWALVD